jgi:hypothetical protein
LGTQFQCTCCHSTSEVTIRATRVNDRRVWESLWHGYLDFYRAVLTPEVTERTWDALAPEVTESTWDALTPEVTESTWDALCDPTPAAHGLVAEQGDQLAVSRTWSSIPPCEPRTRSVT